MKIPIFPGKYHQNGGFSIAMLVYRRVSPIWSRGLDIFRSRRFGRFGRIWYIGWSRMLHVWNRKTYIGFNFMVGIGVNIPIPWSMFGILRGFDDFSFTSTNDWISGSTENIGNSRSEVLLGTLIPNLNGPKARWKYQLDWFDLIWVPWVSLVS